MKKFKKLLCMFLAALMLLSVMTVFAGCGTNDETPDGTGTQNAVTNTGDESDGVDDRFVGVDYKDRSFRIYTSNYIPTDGISNSHFLIEGAAKSEGNLVNDAVLERNITVEDLLGVKLEFTTSDLLYTEVPADIRKYTQSGTDEFDLINNSVYAFSELLIDGHFRNVMDEECVFDFDRVWTVSNSIVYVCFLIQNSTKCIKIMK